ncbi:hypothetical protein [Vibrio alginolyticus]|uniref:hypothetical protein n=1 Tax=Vibrio alginolyticus TaxID=663 RepID=UPI0015F5920A|nr:hypothetical protein [Vibrio alginolyticus]
MKNIPQPLEIKSLSPFVDPFFVNETPNVFVVGDDCVSIYFPSGKSKTNYALVSPLPANTKVRMEFSRAGVKATLQSEVEAYQHQLQFERDEKRKAEQDKLEQAVLRAAQEAAEFNESLNIPFRWCSDIKVVMSGMQENSNGSGFNRRTVQHVRVLEAYTDGRFSRKKGDFLCGPDHSKHQGYTDHAWDSESKSQVTCKQCIKIAKRFVK